MRESSCRKLSEGFRVTLSSDDDLVRLKQIEGIVANTAADGNDPWTPHRQAQAPTVQHEHTMVALRNGPLVVSLPGR